MKRIVVIAAFLVLAPALAWTGFWLYATMTIAQPFNEIWIETNSRMPTAVRQWGCRTVRARLSRPTLPPYGCQGAGEW